MGAGGITSPEEKIKSSRVSLYFFPSFYSRESAHLNNRVPLSRNDGQREEGCSEEKCWTDGV